LKVITSERWKRVVAIFDSVVQHSPAQRAAFLDDACASDAALRAEVEAMLAADAEAGSFLERPAVAGWAAALAAPDAPERDLPAGTRLGSYEVVAFVGAGGMGRVYRARDTRLGRDVALKVLPPAASGREALARFQNEVRAVAALNHPAIVTVHDVGEADGMPFFAMELIEGSSLRHLLAAGALPLPRTLAIAAQIARGLAAAHARGIVHRDLKPENVMIAGDGVVKILDFGLAKLLASPPQAGDETMDLATRPGTIVGTAGYMSPEQASGRAVDFRADHFAFGAILYEMIAGRRAFDAASTIETLAAVMRDEPPPLPEGARQVPLPVLWILDRCLAKEPDARYASTTDLARDIERAAHPERRPALQGGSPSIRRWGRWAAAGAAALVGLAVGALGARGVSGPASPAAPPSLRHLTHSGSDYALDVSPDGRLIAFASHRDGRRRIWIKQVGRGAEAALTDGPGDDQPRFSPDGASILFTRSDGDSSSLYYVPAVGGPARRVLADARGGDWSPDGQRLVFVRSARDEPGPAYLVGVAGARGEDPRVIHRLQALAANVPRWSPDSRRVALTHAHGAALLWSILLLDVDGTPARVLEPPRPTGRLSPALWMDGGRKLLYSQADATESSTSGRLIVQDLGTGGTRTLMHVLSLGSAVDLGGAGTVAFTVERLRGNLRELTLERGRVTGGRWLTRGDSDDRQPSYSADGRRLVFSSNRDGGLDLWSLLSPTGALERLTEGGGEDWDPRLTAAGKLLWSSKRTGNFEVWSAEADGSVARQVTHDGVDAENPAVTPDGRWIVYASHHPARRGLWKVHVDGTEPQQLAAGNLGLPEISPDGTLVLYGAFSHPTSTLRVLRLADGGAVPFEVRLPSVPRNETGFVHGRARWMPDGRAIAFVGMDAQGRTGVFVQDFVPGLDTSARRRALAGFDAEAITESFGIAPDGSRMAITLRERTSHIVLASGVAGVEP
jgi:eukaryotic-like serine/threonine-protein kinase